MSASARQLRTPVPAGTAAPARTPARSRSLAPERTPAARPRAPSPVSSPSARRRARRRSTPAFWVLTFLIVTALVVGIVSISALLVRASFQEEDLRARIGALAVTQEGLIRDVADLSSPVRIQAWARAQGMVIPDRVVTLRVANAGSATAGSTRSGSPSAGSRA